MQRQQLREKKGPIFYHNQMNKRITATPNVDTGKGLKDHLIQVSIYKWGNYLRKIKYNILHY